MYYYVSFLQNALLTFLGGSGEELKVPILFIGAFIILWLFYQLEAIMIRKIGDISLNIPNKILLVALFTVLSIVPVGIAINRADFSEPLSKKQVELAVLENFGKSIRRISFLKGGGAGDIGYFFVELEPNGYVVVNGDARLLPFIESNYKEKLNFSDYFLRRTSKYPFSQMSVQTTFPLQWESFKNCIFRRKNIHQIFWGKYALGGSK
jgi:hypothetical protein